MEADSDQNEFLKKHFLSKTVISCKTFWEYPPGCGAERSKDNCDVIRI